MVEHGGFPGGNKLMSRFALLAVLSTLGAGCAHTYIEGTTVPDSEENRAILGIIGKLEQALKTRNSDDIVELVSPNYFEDMGTPDQSDDYGYSELTDRVLPGSMKATKEMHVAFKVHDIVVDSDRAYADIRYSSRAHIDMPAGAFWDSHKEFNRIEFALENDSWKITSGL